jgi:phenylacetate-CoA ligase
LDIRPITKADFRRHYPTGTFSRKPERDWRYISTSGTTDRLSVVANFIKRDYRRCCELRALQIAVGGSVGINTVEIPPNVCNVVCGIDDSDPRTLWQVLWQGIRQKSLFQEKMISELRGLFERDILMRKRTLLPIEPGPAASLTEQLDERLKVIRQENPQILRGYPLYLLWLAERALQTNLTFPKLNYILPYGGLASPRMIERIEAGFQAPFRNVYGTSELGSMAAACGQSTGMHLFEDLFLFQMDANLDSSAEPVGNLIITDLINTAMPMVRYRVGDIGRLHLQACRCGRKTPRVEVLGRRQETLLINGAAVPASAIADTFFTDSAIGNGRVDEVAPSCFEAAVVQVPGGPTPNLLAWEERFRALAAGPIKRLRSKLVSFLRPESSGKYLMIWPAQKPNREDR